MTNLSMSIKDRTAMAAELDRLIGRRTGWVLFYRSQWGEGWAKRIGGKIHLWHQSRFVCGDAHTASVWVGEDE